MNFDRGPGMTYFEKIQELHMLSGSLLQEYRIVALEINSALTAGKPVGIEVIRFQDEKLKEFSRVMEKYNSVVKEVVQKKISLRSEYVQAPESCI